MTRIQPAFLILLSIAAGTWATTSDVKEVTCPACGHEFYASVLTSTSIAGRDADFCPHAAGANALLFITNTCDKCWYSGYLSDFTKVKLTEDQKARLRRELKPLWQTEAPPPWRLPAIVRYDLIAQTYTILGRPQPEIAQQYLQASWAARLDGQLTSNLPAEMRQRGYALADQLRAELTREIRWRDLADFNIQMAARLCEKARAMGDEDKLGLMLRAIDLLAPHGETEAIHRIIAEIRPLLPADQYATLVKTIEIRLDWQHHFQLKAAGLFEATLDQVEPAKRAEITYLCGELYRRAGQPAKARTLFRQARAAHPSPALLELIEAQEKRLPAE